jgi:hypothetical protein
MKVFLISVVVASVVGAGAASARAVPPAVAAHLKEMAAFCKAGGGHPLPSDIVETGRLANGMRFWSIEEARFQCDGAQALFGLATVSQGQRVLVFARLPDHRVTKVFDKTVLALKRERSGPSTTLWATVGGGWCGQRHWRDLADAVICRRPLVWDSKTEGLKIGPLSQARFPYGRGE